MKNLRLFFSELLDSDTDQSQYKIPFNRYMGILIILNVIAMMLETLPSFPEEYRQAFFIFEVFSISIFTIEYLIRLWVYPDFKNQRLNTTWQSRRQYLLSPMAIIDLLAILPFFLMMFTSIDLRFLRAARLFRVVKVMRYSNAMDMLFNVLKRDAEALYAGLALMSMMLIISASGIYYLEHDAQPEAFASIPAALWWGITTITTVGYGDLSPITPWGKVLGGIVMVIGVGMFALPTGILASGFNEEMQRQRFLNKWKLVASVPLFSGLTALEIAEITDMLTLRKCFAGEMVIRKEDKPTSMYFIASGEVEIFIHETTITLYSGQYFGEIALILGGERRAVVQARSYVELLQLEDKDLKRMYLHNPDLMSYLEETARERDSKKNK